MKNRTIRWLLILITPVALLGCSKPDLPVSVSFRQAMLDRSLVAQLHNNASTTLKVVVEVNSRTTGQTKQAELVLGGRAMEEIGWAEGWRFVRGEAIRIRHADYRDVKVTVP